MAIKSHKLGPGVLTIGAGPLALEEQAVKATIKWKENVTSTPAIPVLSGGEIPEEEEVAFRCDLELEVLQDDLAAAGMVDYTWTNKGTTQPFTFRPNTALARKITGTVTVVPIDVGGEVKKRNTSTVTMRCTIAGNPTLSNYP